MTPFRQRRQQTKTGDRSRRESHDRRGTPHCGRSFPRGNSEHSWANLTVSLESAAVCEAATRQRSRHSRPSGHLDHSIGGDVQNLDGEPLSSPLCLQPNPNAKRGRARDGTARTTRDISWECFRLQSRACEDARARAIRQRSPRSRLASSSIETATSPDVGVRTTVR